MTDQKTAPAAPKATAAQRAAGLALFRAEGKATDAARKAYALKPEGMSVLAYAALITPADASHYGGDKGTTLCMPVGEEARKALTGQDTPEALYFRKVGALQRAMQRIADEGKPAAPAKRKPRGKGADSTPDAPKAPEAPAVADGEALRQTVASVMSGRTVKGVSPKVAKAIRDDAASLLQVKPEAPAPATVDAAAMRKALADMITAGTVGDSALAEACARYVKAHAAAARASVKASA